MKSAGGPRDAITNHYEGYFRVEGEVLPGDSCASWSLIKCSFCTGSLSTRIAKGFSSGGLPRHVAAIVNNMTSVERVPEYRLMASEQPLKISSAGPPVICATTGF
ncbi:uncharacterized protein [Drosophila bipectinata]|uniref:uncharacterized protein n=1 Tax=Drosophila bipectinata TaxID=42026 RepID=UPI0038B3D846